MARPIPKTICLACPFNSLKSQNKKAFPTFSRINRLISIMPLGTWRLTPVSGPCKKNGAGIKEKKKKRSARYCRKCYGQGIHATRISFIKLKLDRCSLVSARQCTSHLTMRSTKMSWSLLRVPRKMLSKLSKITILFLSNLLEVEAVCGRQWPKWPRNKWARSRSSSTSWKSASNDTKTCK